MVSRPPTTDSSRPVLLDPGRSGAGCRPRTRSMRGSTDALTDSPSGIDEGRMPSTAGSSTSEVAHQQREGDLQRQVGLAQVEADEAEPMTVDARRPRRAGAPRGSDDGPHAIGELDSARRPMWTVERSTKRRSGSSGSVRSMAGSSIRPPTVPKAPSASGIEVEGGTGAARPGRPRRRRTGRRACRPPRPRRAHRRSRRPTAYSSSRGRRASAFSRYGVAVADEQRARRLLGGHDGEGAVVGRSAHRSGEPRLDHAGGGRHGADQRLGALAGRNRQVPRIHQRAVGIDLQPPGGLDR